MEYIIDLAKVNSTDINTVGGKNASTGEMIQHLAAEGINVPGGFATTAQAFRKFLAQNNLDKKIAQLLSELNTDNVSTLDKVSADIRRRIIKTPFFPEFEQEVSNALSKINKKAFAVRSSATAEDLPEASFAGQQETYLNVSGLKNILHAIKLVFASLFTSRAIAYRHHHGFIDKHFAISAGIQPMVRSDKGTSGVLFTLDTESGFDKVILINASYGLGEAIVQGQVNPDEFYVYKPNVDTHHFSILQRKLGEKALKMIYASAKHPTKSIKTIAVSKSDRARFCLSDQDIQALAHMALTIEKHYKMPMDIEWAKDGLSGELYILQARPETIRHQNKLQEIEQFHLTNKGELRCEGLSVGQRIGSGKARIILDTKKMHLVKPGEVIVTDMTDPDWEPIIKELPLSSRIAAGAPVMLRLSHENLVFLQW